MGKRFLAVAIVVVSACTALELSTTSQSSVVVSVNPYTFNGSGTMTFTLTAKGSADHDILQSIEMMGCSSQWKLDTTIDPQMTVMGAHVCGANQTSGSGSGSAGACPPSYQFAVMYAATQSGTSSCNVAITSSAYGTTNTAVETLVLSGTSAGGITVSPMTIDFNDVQIATTSTAQQVKVTNIGSASVMVTTSPPANLAFQVTPPTATIGAGSSAFFNVTCTPPAPVPYTDTVTFMSGSYMGTTSLSCNGINSSVNFTPTHVTFEKTLVGRPPGKASVTVSGGSGTLIEEVSLDAAAIAAGVTIVDNPEGTFLGSAQTISLAYAAAAVHEAGPLGVLSVKVSTDQVARQVGISGETLHGAIGTNPASVELGAICVGSTAMKTVEVYASEAGDVELQQLTKPAAPFDAAIQDTLPKMLLGNHTGASATVKASMAPTAAGEFNDMFVLTSDIPNKAMTEVKVHGIGIATGIAATPDVVHFGTIAPGATTSIKEVQLTNCGSSALDFSRAQLVGPNATEFTLIGANPARVLQPTESEIFMVVMQPRAAGFKSAQLVIEHSAGTTTADLDGTADGDLLGGKDRETYYACSTGHPVALWPLAVALVLVRRRRRQRR